LEHNYKNFLNYDVDVRNFSNLEKIFKKYKKKISVIIHCAAQPSHDYGKNYPIIDFNINATGTLNLLELTKKFCPDSCFIFMSTNKVYGDNPNNLKIYETKNRFELKKNSKYYNGINESFSIDNCIHSFFGVSKTYADLMVQEYGRNVGLKTVSFRGGCITGPNHSGAKLHGFLSYLIKSCISEKKYTLIGYNGKQVRDNLHSNDLINCFWEYYKKPNRGEIYNIGGGRYSNCSILEALNLVEQIKKIEIKKKIIRTPRVGDHIWYISDTAKFQKHYPKWKQKYNTKKIIEELIDSHS
jgi:CDP-paratose 2-epimerase